MADQFAKWDEFYARYQRDVTPEKAMERYKKSRQRKTEEPPEKTGLPPGEGAAGLNLKSHHAKLNAEGYVPPPPKEDPLVYAGKVSGGRKLTDEQVIYARANIGTLSIGALAKELNVAYATLKNAVKGFTYRHLNAEYPPQR